MHRNDSDATPDELAHPAESVRYPTNHVVAIVDKTDQVTSAARALKDGGFLDTEVQVTCGQDAATALGANTGRTGVAHLAIRLAERIGVSNDEMALKDRYEQALRDGKFVVSVLAPTDERKTRAGKILRDHGADFVNFLGRFAIEDLRR